jgi:ribosome-binding protein aMBF1 (putative translation factor)
VTLARLWRKCVLARNAKCGLDYFASWRDYAGMLTEQAIHSFNRAIQKVRAFRTKKGWTLNRFAKEVGLRESTIRYMDDPDWRPEFDTLRKLESFVENGAPQ